MLANKGQAMSTTTTIQYFSSTHLPGALQAVAGPIEVLARKLEAFLPGGPEKSAGMRKLLEAKDCFVRCALDLPPATVPPHQQRVLDEQADLLDRLAKLDAFILDNPVFLGLPEEDRQLLEQQSKTMAVLTEILATRIERFGKPE